MTFNPFFCCIYTDSISPLILEYKYFLYCRSPYRKKHKSHIQTCNFRSEFVRNHIHSDLNQKYTISCCNTQYLAVVQNILPLFCVLLMLTSKHTSDTLLIQYTGNKSGIRKQIRMYTLLLGDEIWQEENISRKPISTSQE